MLPYHPDNFFGLAQDYRRYIQAPVGKTASVEQNNAMYLPDNYSSHVALQIHGKSFSRNINPSTSKGAISNRIRSPADTFFQVDGDNSALRNFIYDFTIHNK